MADFFEVAVEAPLNHTLTYKVPSELLDQIKIGSRVVVPLGSRKSMGVVLNKNQPPTELEKKIKFMESATADPQLDPRNLQWLQKLSQYYLHPLGLVYSMAFAPQATKRKRKGKNAFSIKPDETPEQIFTPNKEQAAAIKQIVESSQKDKFDVFLLFGVTGSGKTEVYLRSIEEILKAGKEVLVLVPEISLTPQLMNRFVNRFGENVAMIHSHLTEREKSDQWQDALSGKKKILVGARSALFCPLKNLGLIIIDEEHEGSFKQEEQLKYNARDAAIMKANIFQCPIVLGSATPSLETWHNSEIGKYKRLELTERVENRPMPKVEVIDLRDRTRERAEVFTPPWMSAPLYNQLKEKLQRKEQSALFINRRGYAQFALCSDCGFVEECPNCSVTLTLHGRGQKLLCHYCGFEKPKILMCPSCKTGRLQPIGTGTQKIAEELKELFPEARIARADRDEINTRTELEAFLDKINKHEVDIIIGTQMIAKGHDFPQLTLVGSVAADMGLHFPDFRSSERTFQLLTQVAGRAGRHQKEGVVLVQTYLPEHPAIHFSKTHDYRGFAAKELSERQELTYPPFGKMAIIRIQATSETKAHKIAMQAKTEINGLKRVNGDYEKIEVLGPAPAALAKIKNKFRFQILLKTPSAKGLNVFLQHFLKTAEKWNKAKTATITVDVDPVNLL